MVKQTQETLDRQVQQLIEAECAQGYADDGFSAAVIRKVQRKLWLQKLLIASMVLAGFLVSAGTLVDFIRPLTEALNSWFKLSISNAALLSGPNLTVLAAGLLAAVLAGLAVLFDENRL